MLLFRVTAFLVLMYFVLTEGGPHVRLSPRNDLKPSLELKVVLEIEASNRTSLAVVDISTEGGKQLSRSHRYLRTGLPREFSRGEVSRLTVNSWLTVNSRLTVNTGISMESLWKAYRNRWTLELCAVLIEGDKPSDSVTSSHVHDAFHGGEDDYDISDGLLENEWWYLSMSHKDLLDMSLSYDCWTIGRVSRKDLFCWNWLAVLRGKIEKTCHNDNGIFHLLDFPLAMSGGSSGITRQPSTWQPHFDYWNEFPPLEPRVSLAVLLFATRHCDSSLCSVLVRPKSVVYQSPSLFLQSNGALVTQFGLVSGRGKAYVSPWSIPLNEWVYLTLSCHGLKMEVCMWFGSSSLPQCYDLNFPEPVHYDSTIPWTIGSASSLQSFQGYISQVTIYQGFYLNKKNFPRPHKTFHWLTVDELKHNCFMLTKSIGLLQQFGMATENVSCSVDEWLPNVFTYHVLNKKESGSWSVEAAQLALAFIQSKLNLSHHKVHSLIHEANIPDSLLSKFYRNMISWLKGNAVSFEPNAYAIYAGCYDNPNALFYAGITHLIEQPDHNNKQKGITLLLAAAAQGSVLAQLALGYRHRFGIDDVPESCPMALSYYLGVARDALDIFRGEDETRSITEAIRLSEPEMVKSQDGERTDVVQYLMYEADYGNPDAQADLGLMHYWGQQGLQRDFNMAFHYYQQAARAGLPIAQYSLAIMYLKGHGTQQDNETALKYLTSAAGQGIVAALNGLGYYYLNVADPPNVTAAVNYFERAAELGNHDAAFNLGIIHYNGQTGVPNKAKAVKYWRKAARYGNAGASYQLALLSETCSEALEYSVAVAEQHSDIGLVLKKGVSSYLNNSMLKAIFHYIQAAEAGKEVAAFNVAWLSETCQDLQATIGAQLSKRYYSQSALLNYTPAIIRVGDSYWFGEWTEINKEFAMASYSQAAHLYNGQGLFNLGYIIQEGKLPVKREWVDFQVLSLGPRIQGNLTLASQLYDLCWEYDSHGQLACFLAGMYVEMLMLRDGLLFQAWTKAALLWRYLYFFSALSGCIVGLIAWFRRT